MSTEFRNPAIEEHAVSPWVGLGLRDDVHDGDINKKQAQLTVVFYE